MKKITYDIEWNVERFHWWFTGRRRLLKILLSSSRIHKNSLVIDVGCGVGSNLSLLNSMGFNVIGIDSEIYSLSFAKKNVSVSLINGDLSRLPIKSNSIDIIIATDILEHLNEDTTGIKEMYRTLAHRGIAVLTVPAFEFLWGTQDVVGMHKRRYSKNEFLKKLRQAGFDILKSSYFNFILFIPIFIARRLIHFLGLKIESENEINSPLINFFLKAIFSIESHMLKFFSFPFGVSIFCVAQKK